jgi:DDE_Tnp_1-associated/Transposase DDE domain
MERTYRPLIEALAEVPDPRSRHGRRYALPALLGLACAALLCGHRTYSAMAEWGRNYDPELLRALGFTRATAPCAATFFLVFRALDRAVFERVLGRWAEQVLGTTTPTDALALDGKALRGSRKHGAPGTHLLSVVSQTLGLTLAQTAVDDKTNEIPVAPQVLRELVLTGRVVTMDALLTQREVARAILDGGGDYLMLAKGNQPQLEQDLATVFTAPPSRNRSGRPRRSTKPTAASNGDV